MPPRIAAIAIAIAIAVAVAAVAIPAARASDEDAAQLLLDLPGHWEGELGSPGETVGVAIDVQPSSTSGWLAELDAAGHGLLDHPLRVTVEDVFVKLEAHELTLVGHVSPDGRVLLGHASQGADGFPFELKRAGPARISDLALALDAAPHDVPPPAPLSADGAELKARFNSDRDHVRILAVLSPTAPSCLRAARVVQDDVLAGIDDSDLRIYAVWQPVLLTDDARAVRAAASLLFDHRVSHYWERERGFGRLLQPAIGLTSEPAWDVVLVYAAGTIWDEGAPVPTALFHQLRGRLPPENRFRGSSVRSRVKGLLRELR